MPQVFRIGSYWVYFWANEGKPSEPIHVHVSEGNPSENATKIWITASGRCLLEHNNSYIPSKALRNIMRIIEARSREVMHCAAVSDMGICQEEPEKSNTVNVEGSIAEHTLE